MNLKYITNSRIPTKRANGVQIMIMCNAFSMFVKSVELIVPKRFNKIKTNPFKYYKLKKSFKIKHIFSFDTISLIRESQPLFLKKFLFWVQWISFGFSTLRYAFSKDIIYTRDEFVVTLLSMFSKNCVYEVHRLPDSMHLLYRFVFSRCKNIVTINSYLKKTISKKYGINENKIFVAHDAIDEKEFSTKLSKAKAKKILEIDSKKTIIMYIGALEGWKGHETLLGASKSLDASFEVVIIGGDKETISKLKKKYPKVKFLGFKPYYELHLNQQAADILIVPNSGKHKISKYYTSPLKLFAYMASNRPIICSDLPSMREIVSEKDVLFFESDSVKDLTNSINKLAKNSKLQKDLAKSCFKKVKDYTWDNRAQEILKSISQGKNNNLK
jgi:glycosyltransferase involved in cell wall biosynthesis